MLTHSVCTRAFLLILVIFSGAALSFGQSITAGDVIGTVTDPSGAAVPNAAVTLTNTETNSSQKAATNGEGTYRFAFVPPGTCKVAVNASGFQAVERTGLAVSAAQPTALNLQLTVASSSQTVDVIEAPSAPQTENADVRSTFSRRMVQDLPNPGGDLTYVAQTAPGVVMNTQAGYGNFVADGMPVYIQPFHHQRAEL